jgi:hypothetical protein
MKYMCIGFMTVFMFITMLIYMANLENDYALEKYNKSTICYSYFIDNLKQKDLFGENFNFTKPCYQSDLIPKVTYHISNFINCYEGKYIGQPSTSFPLTALCREKFVINILSSTLNDFQNITTETPIIDAIWEKICISPDIIMKLEDIKAKYDCL